MNMRIDIELAGATCPVHLGAGLLADRSAWKASLAPGRILVVSNEVVARLYLDRLRAGLGNRESEVLVLPDGEAQKTLDSWRRIIDRLASIGALRDTTVVALGGGVVGDIAGFAAACYMRGIRVVQAPTTLLAQVDASVGGKTGVNHPTGKNLVGAFHQPAAVIIDTDTLDSLPGREFAAGMAEVIKYGAIRDAELFGWLEDHAVAIEGRDQAVIAEMIGRSVRNKAEVVARDERETGIRATLNFGHSFGHALETLTGYSRYLHGETVAIGMVAAARLSEQRGLCPPGCAERLAALLEAFDLPVAWPDGITAGQAVDAMSLDKKALSSGLRLVLLRGIGKAVIDAGSDSRAIVRAIESGTESAA